MFLGLDLVKSDGPLNVSLKFNDYGMVNRFSFEACKLWAGLSAYIERDYAFHVALHDLVKRCFEVMDAELAEVLLDGFEKPWYRFSRSEAIIPLPEFELDEDEWEGK